MNRTVIDEFQLADLMEADLIETVSNRYFSRLKVTIPMS